MAASVRVCAAFASTGGNKLTRTLRSFRRMEEELFVLVVIDGDSLTYSRAGGSLPRGLADKYLLLPNNRAYINGTLNAAMRFAKAEGFTHVALFHDDVIFSPLLKDRGNLSYWLAGLWAQKTATYPPAPGITLSYLQAFAPGMLSRPPAAWDAEDLESERFWHQLDLGRPGDAGLLPESWKDYGERHTLDFPGFFVQYWTARKVFPTPRLGPAGMILPVAAWEAVGGFDETEGIFYDIGYGAECQRRGLPPLFVVPNAPFLHLHNQSIGFADPARGVWADTMGAFQRRYGKTWEEFGEEVAHAAAVSR